MVVYTVRPGDSLSSVAGRFGLSQSHIVLCNGLSDPARLTSGQCLMSCKLHVFPVKAIQL